MALLAAAFALGGCGHGARTPAPLPPPVRGHADLEALVHRHPGWKGVQQFDQALVRLQYAATHPVPSLTPDTGLGTLPPVDAEMAPTSVPALQAEAQRLSGVQTTQIARLRTQLAQNRERQIAQERESWIKEAQLTYEKAVAAVQAAYARRVARLTSERDVQSVNLTLQIRALEKIVNGWDNSVPPTPELNQAKADLVQKRAALAALDASQSASFVAARASRDQALAQARGVRDAFVQAQTVTRESSLKAADEGQIAAFSAGLSAQRLSLLRDVQAFRASSVPAAGNLGAQALPPEAGGRGGPALANLRAARSRLIAQRARWIAFLYDDTRAAALDVAERRRWIVSFDSAHPQGQDLTAPLGEALTKAVWKG